MSKTYVITALLVLCLLLPGPVVLFQGHPDSEVLAGANLNLPFVRRSVVTCGFGCYPGHVGVDYRAVNFTPVVAAKEGTVTAIRNFCLDPDGGGFNPCAGLDYGNYIFVDNGGGYETRYAHLAQSGFNVWVGKAVARGEQMALSDNSGNSPAPHLHFELRVNGTAVDPYAGSTHWAGSDPFPMGYRDQNGAVQGPFPLDNVKIRNLWVTVARRLGAPIGNDYSYACLAEGTQATGYMQDFERGYIFYCGGGAAQAVYYSTTFLPRILAGEDANAWNSTLSIRNLGTAPANVSVSFLRSNGTVLDSRLYAGLPVNATWELRASTVVFDWLVNEGSTFQGSAIVASDQDIAVIVRTERSNRVTAYTGLSSLDPGSGWGRPAASFYAPTVMWNPWERSTWKSYLYIQNTTPDQANLTVTYCCQNNPSSCRTETDVTSLPPYGSARVDPGGEMGNFCTQTWGFWGFARVTSTNGKALAVVVTQEEDKAGASDYNAFYAGARTVYLPSLMREWYNWSSSFTVQNLGDQPTYVDVVYYGENGSGYRCRLSNLGAGTSCLVTQDGYVSGCTAEAIPLGIPLEPCAVPEGWHGTAILQSDGQPIAAVVNQQLWDWPPGSGSNSAQSYSGFLGGGSTLYGPLAGRRGASGGFYFDSCNDVQNVGASTTDITSAYFYRSGGQVPNAGRSERNVLPGAVAMFYVPAESQEDFLGSVRITRSAGAVAGIHNVARLKNSAGDPTPGDFAASYNLVQR